MKNMNRFMVAALIGILSISAFAEDTANAGGGADEDAVKDLAKATQNPISDLISVPFQWNVGFETGPEAKTGSVLNIQPVIPINLNEDWNLITRTIVPVINQPAMGPGTDRENGVGNVLFTGWFSPSDSGKWIWGVGPAIEMPTNSPDELGSDNWSAGPSVVVVTMDGPWVCGALFNQLWSFAGSDPEVNKFLIQPFVNYNMDDGWYLVSGPIITANWKADSNNRWTVPIGGGIGKIVRFGKQPVNIAVHAYHNIESPKNGADWSARFQIQLLFPK